MPRITRSFSLKIKEKPSITWTVENNDKIEKKSDKLNLIIRRKAASPKNKSKKCDENTSKENSPLKLTPKRKLFQSTDNAEECSPSKQKCSPIETPSTLLKSLALEDEKPAGHLKPKSLFSTAGNVSQYKDARIALHSSLPTSLPCREQQIEILKDFLINRSNDSEGSIYISGAPGTGKTASVNFVLNIPEIKNKYKVLFINCTSVTSSKSIYNKIAEGLNIKNDKNCSAAIQKYITSCKKDLLFILDEIDQLESKNQSILYTIFEWPCLARSKLTLMGIANSMDLTDRLLPRLQARKSCKPKLLHFEPYSKEELSEIINSRLQQAGADNIFNNFAVEMLSAKVASMSGDVRKALDIGRRVVEIVESKSKILKPTNINSPRKTQQSTVGILEVREVLDGVYGSAQTFIAANDAGLPIQQKILICSLLLVLKKGKNKDLTVGRLYDVFRRVCGKRNIHDISSSEFYSMCTLVETRGIIRIATSKKDNRQSKITLQWDENDVFDALCDKTLLAAILEDISCL